MGIAQYGSTQYSGSQVGGTTIPDLETNLFYIDGNNTSTKTKSDLMKQFKINDEKPEFDDTLKQGDGTVIDLSNADKVEIRYRDPDQNVSSDTVTISGASSGKVEYQFPTDEIDQEGLWLYEYLVTLSDGTEITVPNGDNYESIVVGDRL